MKRAIHAVALLVILAAALPALATSPGQPPGSASGAAVVVTPPPPPVGDLFNQYGDPDDAITGNRSNNVAGGTPAPASPTGSSIPTPAPAQWLLWLHTLASLSI
jgi:hypothetical protein